MRDAVFAAFVLAACGDGKQPASPPPPPPPSTTPSTSTSDACPDGTSLGWDDFARPFVTNWCAACHSSHLTGPARGGAPDLVNLDTYEGVVANAVRVQATATGDTPTMPPGGGPPSEDRAKLLEWLTCGMPGPTEPIPVDPCEAPLFQGDTTLASVDQVEAFCRAYSGTTGALTLEVGGSAACVCEVGGDLALHTAEVTASLPALRTVGGTLTVTDNPFLAVLELPALAQVGGVALARNPALTSLDVGDLATVTGSFEATGDGVGGELSLDGVETVGVDLRLEGLPGLTNVHLLRLVSVGGAVVIRDVGATAVDLGPVDTVGGDVTVADCSALVDLDGMRIVDTIGGTLSISGLPSLSSLGSFFELLSVGQGLVLEDLPALASLDGFSALVTVGGDVVLSGTGLAALPTFPALTSAGTLRFVGHPALTSVPPFGAPGAVLGGLVLREDPALIEIEPLGWVTVSGPVEVCDTSLHDLAGLKGLADVGGDLTVCNNAILENGFGLSDITHVGGDLTMIDNPLLPNLVAKRVALGATIDGDVNVAGNH